MDQSEVKSRKTWQIRVEHEYRSVEEQSENRGAKIDNISRVRSSNRSGKIR